MENKATNKNIHVLKICHQVTKAQLTIKSQSVMNILVMAAQPRNWATILRLSPKLAIISLGKLNLEIGQIVSSCSYFFYTVECKL